MASTRARAVVIATVRPRQLSSSHVTLRAVSAPVSLESTGQTAGSALLDTGTTDPTGARVSFNLCSYLLHVVVP